MGGNLLKSGMLSGRTGICLDLILSDCNPPLLLLCHVGGTKGQRHGLLPEPEKPSYESCDEEAQSLGSSSSTADI